MIFVIFAIVITVNTMMSTENNGNNFYRCTVVDDNDNDGNDPCDCDDGNDFNFDPKSNNVNMIVNEVKITSNQTRTKTTKEKSIYNEETKGSSALRTICSFQSAFFFKNCQS